MLDISFARFSELMLEVQRKSFFGEWMFIFSKGQISAQHHEHGEYRFNSFKDLEEWLYAGGDSCENSLYWTKRF